MAASVADCFLFSSESSGIFVKSVTKDSAVDHDGRIHVGDQIIAVSALMLLFCCLWDYPVFANHFHSSSTARRLFWLFLTPPPS